MESAKCSHRSGSAVLAVLMSRRVVGVLSAWNSGYL